MEISGARHKRVKYLLYFVINLHHDCLGHCIEEAAKYIGDSWAQQWEAYTINPEHYHGSQ